MFNTAAQQKISTNKNRYRILNSLEETIKVIIANKIITELESFIELSTLIAIHNYQTRNSIYNCILLLLVKDIDKNINMATI